MKDPRLIEIELLTVIDRETYVGEGWTYVRPGAIGGDDRQREEALLHLMFDGAVIDSSGYRPQNIHVSPDLRPNPRFPIDEVAKQTVGKFLAHPGTIQLKITQRGRLRLFRLRDEILNRDRVREDFQILWSARHWLPDLDVGLRFHKPGDPFSMLVLDVDRLKMLNTKFSHAGANDVLKGIFQILLAAAAPADAYRLGGDEAGAVLPGVDLDAARGIAEEVRATVEGAFRDKVLDEEGHTPTVTIAVGCLTKPIAAEDFYARVDSHLTRKKDQGGERNKVHEVSLT